MKEFRITEDQIKRMKNKFYYAAMESMEASIADDAEEMLEIMKIIETRPIDK